MAAHTKKNSLSSTHVPIYSVCFPFLYPSTKFVGANLSLTKTNLSLCEQAFPNVRLYGSNDSFIFIERNWWRIQQVNSVISTSVQSIYKILQIECLFLIKYRIFTFPHTHQGIERLYHSLSWNH